MSETTEPCAGALTPPCRSAHQGHEQNDSHWFNDVLADANDFTLW